MPVVQYPSSASTSTSYQWGQIIGTTTLNLGTLSGIPDWIPGARLLSGAKSNCGLTPFTGTTTTTAKVTVTQWFGHPYDGDYAC